MKVLLITDLCRGNAVTLPERHLLRGLSARGVDITLITHWETPESKEVEEMGIRVIYLTILKKISFSIIKKLRELILKEKYDILHLTFGKAITNTLLASRGLNQGIIGYIGSLNVHWHDPTAYLSFLNRRLDRMICLSDGVMEHFLKQTGRKMAARTTRIYKGYDPSWVKIKNPMTREELGIPGDALLVCCIANVRKVKGIPYLINATKYLEKGLPVYFVLAGDNMDSEYHRKLISESPYKDNFRVFGFIHDIFAYTSLCDVYVQPSLTEGLGRSLIECMCLSKPLIVTEKGGSRELVDEGINGFIVPSKSAPAIAEKIKWCNDNRAQLPGMGAMSLRKVREELSPETMVDQTYKVYVDLMKELESR
ncbi:MAG: glycosyltransferase family 4 protein [Bacteroidales bacterium]